MPPSTAVFLDPAGVRPAVIADRRSSTERTAGWGSTEGADATLGSAAVGPPGIPYGRVHAADRSIPEDDTPAFLYDEVSDSDPALVVAAAARFGVPAVISLALDRDVPNAMLRVQRADRAAGDHGVGPESLMFAVSLPGDGTREFTAVVAGIRQLAALERTVLVEVGDGSWRSVVVAAVAIAHGARAVLTPAVAPFRQMIEPLVRLRDGSDRVLA